jgi:hypothetical protein
MDITNYNNIDNITNDDIVNDNKKNSITHIIIIPYRNRLEQLNKWIRHMYTYFNNHLGNNNYLIYIINQSNNIQMFNKGALINIAFLEIKKNNPNYKNIQFIVHDVDIVILKDNLIDYHTKENEVLHPYGDLRPHFGGILGSIYVIYGRDYEKIGGMPNYFGWGGEDVCIARRCNAHNIKINEDNIIYRYSSKYIDEPISATDKNTIKINTITDRINLKKALTENNKEPTDTYNNVNYKILKTKKIRDNIFFYNVLFNII